MTDASGWDALLADAQQVAQRLMARGETLAIAESSTGGLLSAALLAVPGASAFYLGGGVIYTARARHRLLGLGREDVQGLKSATEPYACRLAETVRVRFAADWGLGETGATGPSGNPYGDPAGHGCVAVAGADRSLSAVIATGSNDRLGNMQTFARRALALLAERLA